MDFEGVDLDAAMQTVIDDMGAAARKFKSQRYAPKPKPAEPKAEEPAPAEEGGPSLGELESLLNGG